MRIPNRTLIRAIGFHLISGNVLRTKWFEILDAQETRPINVSSIAALLICAKYNTGQAVNLIKLDDFAEELRLLCTEINNLGYEVIGGVNEFEANQKGFANSLAKVTDWFNSIVHFIGSDILSRRREPLFKEWQNYYS